MNLTICELPRIPCDCAPSPRSRGRRRQGGGADAGGAGASDAQASEVAASDAASEDTAVLSPSKQGKGARASGSCAAGGSAGAAGGSSSNLDRVLASVASAQGANGADDGEEVQAGALVFGRKTFDSAFNGIASVFKDLEQLEEKIWNSSLQVKVCNNITSLSFYELSVCITCSNS